MAYPKSGTAAHQKGMEHEMTRPRAKDLKAAADVAGVSVESDVAERMANSIGPAFEGFAAISGTLPFDLEPASFLLAQALETAK